MISRATILWFLSLLVFTALLEWHGYQQCASLGPQTQRPHAQPVRFQDTPPATFNCQDVWEALPIWVELSALGWLVSAVGFVTSLVRDMRRAIIGLIKHRREAAS